MIEILLADESVTIQKVVELTFSDGPYRVTTVNNGERALDTALRLRPHIVLAATKLGGLSGYQLCALVKRQLAGVPVLLLNGSFERLDKTAVRESGADGVVTKPFVSQDLIRRVEELVRAKSHPLVSTSLGEVSHAVSVTSKTDVKAGAAATNRVESEEPTAGSLSRMSKPPSARGRTRVFLCHASEDKPAIRELYKRFAAEGFHPWLDEEDLLPGEDWKLAITKQLRLSDAVVVCLSPRSVTKKGYIQKEIVFALDILAEHPEGSIFLIPLLLEDCEIPERLAHLHTAKLPLDQGFQRVCRALRKRMESNTDKQRTVGPSE